MEEGTRRCRPRPTRHPPRSPGCIPAVAPPRSALSGWKGAPAADEAARAGEERAHRLGEGGPDPGARAWASRIIPAAPLIDRWPRLWLPGVARRMGRRAEPMGHPIGPLVL